MIMSLVDHHGEVEYPFSIKTVFSAIIDAAPNIEGLELDGADEISGRVTFKAGVSLASWGENIPVQLTQVSKTRTKMQIMSTPKTGVMFGGAMDMGKNRKNIEKIINAVSKILANKEPEVDVEVQSSCSIADEILKLKQLLDAGLLTQEEFDVQKKHILNGTNKPQITSSVASTNQGNPTSSATDPLHIEGNNKDNTTTYCIIAAIVFVIIFILSMV